LPKLKNTARRNYAKHFSETVCTPVLRAAGVVIAACSADSSGRPAHRPGTVNLSRCLPAPHC